MITRPVFDGHIEVTPMDLPLVPLRTFHLVVIYQSLNKAARQLGVTQPAVTQQIQRLERSVGMRLFRRDGRRLVPTEAGQPGA